MGKFDSVAPTSVIVSVTARSNFPPVVAVLGLDGEEAVFDTSVDPLEDPLSLDDA